MLSGDRNLVLHRPVPNGYSYFALFVDGSDVFPSKMRLPAGEGRGGYLATYKSDAGR